MSPEVALNRISPMLSPFISSVVRNGKVGLDATNCLRITDLKSGCTSLTPGPNCDRFKLHIPYAGETLKWDIIFNAQYPELPPDFIFGEDAEFLPDPSALHNLASWNPSNPECLLLVVKELVQQYHQFQCSRLRESSRLMFEYQTLLEEPQYGENMEIYAGKKNNWTGEFSARFLLKLPVDFSNIPTYLLKDVNEDPGEDVALLSVSFEDAEATQVYPKLYLSPRIEQLLAVPTVNPKVKWASETMQSSPACKVWALLAPASWWEWFEESQHRHSLCCSHSVHKKTTSAPEADQVASFTSTEFVFRTFCC
ncbi:BRISC and BRCA1 A complex member 2, transcript variant X5 [Ictidomys tridecemlineatus]|nr:BRISC and BRCA1 A complex member 2, transcript variant X5 [Ictidomys tridecemlineatus]